MRSDFFRVFFGVALAGVIGVAGPSIDAACLATGKPCGGQTTTNDRRCCPGMVCGWGNVCQSGCRIAGQFYANGAVHPTNPCLQCKPSASTTSWSQRNGVACDDHSACTRSDVCRSGVCVGEDPVACPAADACHLAGACDPSTGTCSNPRKPDGTSCTIDNACSLGADVCEFGVCVPAGDACATQLGTAAARPVAKFPKPVRVEPAVAKARPSPLPIEERRRKAIARQLATRMETLRTAPRQTPQLTPTPAQLATFNLFAGYWLRDTIDDFSQATALKFYRDTAGEFRVKFYEGTQNALREVNDNDLWFALNPVAPLGSDVPVSVIGTRALRIHNTALPGTELSSDELASTARIQDADANVLYAQFWTNWDGTGDDARYGSVENLSRYRRIAQPAIQRNDQASTLDWSNPVEIFRYVHDYYALQGQTQKAEALEQVTWVGSAGYEALYNQFRTTGVTRTATTSTLQRGGLYIGVWRTMSLAYPFTTIHTAAPHRFTPGSAVTITGFTGVYAVLNGVHHVPASPPSTWTSDMPEPWEADSSRQPYVLVDVDTSGIAEAYDPNVHGVGQLATTHGPITAGTEYRPLVAAVCDFVVSAFGPGTHTRPRIWVRGDFQTVPATFAELRQGLLDGTIQFTEAFRTRDFAAKGNPDLYWNPWMVGGGRATPEFNVNDPFGLGFVAFDPNFDHDINLENYLDPASARNVFFTITGPTLPSEPITAQLLLHGYPSNGSQVVFRTGAFATPPPDLVDAYGVHPFVPYASADNDFFGNLFTYHMHLLGGMVRSDLACGRKVAYIRIGSEDAFDSPLSVLSTRSLAFGRADMQSKVKSNWTSALAALLADLEAEQPDRYVLDMRRNDGGFSYAGDAFAALFGGNRPGQEAVVSLVQAGLSPSVTRVTGSTIATANNSLAANLATGSTVQTDEAAAVFPNSIVRGDAGRRVDVIVLTSTHAGSGGDLLPHSFLGPNPASRVHDLGHNVFARIMGDIDGRLWSGLKGNDAPGVNPVNPDLVQFGQPRTALYLVADAGVLNEDRHGTLVNPQTWTQPATLLRGWFDQTGWQDLGLIPPAVSYPLGICVKPLPSFGVPSTWRDVWLEHAIVD